MIRPTPPSPTKRFIAPLAEHVDKVIPASPVRTPRRAIDNNHNNKHRITLIFLQRFFGVTFLFVTMIMMVRVDRLLNAALRLEESAFQAPSSLKQAALSPNDVGKTVIARRSYSGFDTDDIVSINGSSLSLSLSSVASPRIDSGDAGYDDKAQQTSTQLPKYAYMFLIGGIDPVSPGYRGFIYNVMIATYLLRKNGSNSDIVLFLQMGVNATVDTLPAKEEQELLDLGIKYRYMDKAKHSTFSHIIMEKFQILTLTQYERVIFMDADVLPVINMDYYMDLSVQGVFQPNFVVATRGEPADAGLFMVAPKEGDYAALQKIIDDQRESAKDIGYPFFDKINGWGHSFMKEGDKWEGTEKSGVKWGFWCAHADQGLLYYWTKYYQKAVTIFRGNVVENWVNGTNGKPFLNSTMDPWNVTQQYAPPGRSTVLHNCYRRQRPDNYMCKMPYQDYIHYTGKSKPWQGGFNRREWSRDKSNGYYGLWFTTLFDASNEYGWNITADNVNDLLQGESPLGYFSWYGHRAVSDHNWTAES